MENLVIWMSYGYFSFYIAGNFIGFDGNNLKAIALLGLSLGCVSEITGKSILKLISNK